MKRAFASAALAVLLAMPASAAGVEKTQGVYVTFLSGLKADVGETAAKAASALKGAGFTVLASFDNGVPLGSQAKARTIVFASEPWATEVLSGGADKAFGLPMTPRSRSRSSSRRRAPAAPSRCSRRCGG